MTHRPLPTPAAEHRPLRWRHIALVAMTVLAWLIIASVLAVLGVGAYYVAVLLLA